MCRELQWLFITFQIFDCSGRMTNVSVINLSIMRTNQISNSLLIQSISFHYCFHQFLKNNYIKRYPPIWHDVSFWLGDTFHPNKFHEIVRELGGDLVEVYYKLSMIQ